jgi:hypothetical protein
LGEFDDGEVEDETGCKIFKNVFQGHSAEDRSRGSDGGGRKGG